MSIISQRLNESIVIRQKLLNDTRLHNKIDEVVEKILHCFKSGNAVYFCGNGGSAADAQHLASELSGKFYLDRKPLPSEALNCNTSFLTAVANDFSFEMVYSRLISALGKNGDILIGLTTSGDSQNVLKALVAAKDMGIYTIAFTGESGGIIKNVADITINVPSNDTPRIQELHITIGHIICEIVEQELFGKE